MNTNKYASIKRMDTREREREWVTLVSWELRVFIGAIIYIGMHEEPQIECYWNTNIKEGPYPYNSYAYYSSPVGTNQEIPSHFLYRGR